MHIDITGRHVGVTRALRSYTEERLKKLERLLDGPLEAHVVLAVEKHRHLAEIQVKSRTAVLAGAKETDDLYASINEVVGRIERQALKHKEKLSGRNKRTARKIAAARPAAAPRRRAAPGRAKKASPRVLPSERYRLKPLSSEDAAMELEGSGAELLVYRDARTYRVNVVYKRTDGSFGLVDPEF